MTLLPLYIATMRVEESARFIVDYYRLWIHSGFKIEIEPASVYDGVNFDKITINKTKDTTNEELRSLQQTFAIGWIQHNGWSDKFKPT